MRHVLLKGLCYFLNFLSIQAFVCLLFGGELLHLGGLLSQSAFSFPQSKRCEGLKHLRVSSAINPPSSASHAAKK
jgi:hypothetical protein